MKRLVVLFTLVLMALGCFSQRVIVVQKGSVQSLLEAISQANRLNASPDAERLFILIPDGYYDLGETALTRISGHQVALVGQSTEGTVIRNAPSTKIESISKTAVFQNRGQNNYFQARRTRRLPAGQGHENHLQPCADAVLSGHLLL